MKRALIKGLMGLLFTSITMPILCMEPKELEPKKLRLLPEIYGEIATKQLKLLLDELEDSLAKYDLSDYTQRYLYMVILD